MDISKRYVVVRLEDGPDAEQITVISSTWLRENATKAVYSHETTSRYYRYVKLHSADGLISDPVAITIFLYTNSFQHAREQERQVADGFISSSDGTVVMGLPSKRRIRPTVFSSDDEDEPRKRPRVQEPTFRQLVPPPTAGPSTPSLVMGDHACVHNCDTSKELKLLTRSIQDLKTSVCMDLRELKESNRVLTNTLRQFMQTTSAELSARRTLPLLPITTFTDVMNFELKMSDESVLTSMNDQLRCITGANLSHFVFALMERVMAKQLCLEFTFSGCRSGYVFKHSKLCLFLIQQVLQRPRFATESRQTVAKVIRAWFNTNRDKRHQVTQMSTTNNTAGIP